MWVSIVPVRSLIDVFENATLARVNLLLQSASALVPVTTASS